MNDPRINCPQSLQRYMNERFPGFDPAAPKLHHPFQLPNPRLWWNRLMNWAPTEDQIRRIGVIAGICDFWIKAAVIGAALYLAAEIGWAFWPGHAVDRVLGGLR